MLLVIDAGNTNIVFGLYQQEQLVHHFRMATVKERTVDEYVLFMFNMFQIAKKPALIEGAAISSVVLEILKPLKAAVKKFFNIEPVIAQSSMEMGITLRYNHPKELGSDRFLNAVAAYTLYQGPVIIVDFGTATTFGAVNSKGEFLGGAICPGIHVSLEALASKTSRLPRVDIAKPSCAIGTHTVSNIQSGVFLGHVGQAEYLIRRMKSEMGEESVKVVATGGLCGLMAGATDEIDEIRESLTLEGLKIIYEKAKNEK